MAETLTVEQARAKVIQLAPKEASLDWKSKTKITVRGKIAKVGEPRNEGRYRDVWLRQELEDGKTTHLKVTVSKSQWRDDVGKLGEKDVGTEQTFTGVASMWEDQISGETIYSLYGEIGDGTRARSGGGSRNWNPRAPIVGMLFNQGMASFDPAKFIHSDLEYNTKEISARMDCVIRCITDKRVDALLARANPQKTEDKPKETTEEPEDTDDPFGEN